MPGLGGALSARGARGAAGAPGVREWLGLADSRPPAPWVSAVGRPRLFPCGLNYSCLPVHVPETMFSGCIWKPKSLRFVWTGFYLRRRRVRLWLAKPGPASCAEVTTPWGSCHTGPCSPRIQVPRGMLLSPLGAPNGTRGRGGVGVGNLAKAAVSLNHPQIPENKKHRAGLKGSGKQIMAEPVGKQPGRRRASQLVRSCLSDRTKATLCLSPSTQGPSPSLLPFCLQ